MNTLDMPSTRLRSSIQPDECQIRIWCIICKQSYVITVKGKDYAKWRAGELAQYAFPYLSAGDRDLLITQICNDCFDRLPKD